LAAKIGFDNELAHRIYAGADMFLVPSRYEPCGLTQMYSLKYGAAPIVRATGGLDDTIVDYNPDTNQGNGFKFRAPNAREFFDVIRKAVVFYQNADEWRKLILNGMKADFSWDRSARTYLDLYESLANK
jgi:starch synthase